MAHSHEHGRHHHHHDDGGHHHHHSGNPLVRVAQALGPVLLGMGAPVSVVQAGDDVEDIVAIAAVAAMDAAGR